MPFNSLFVVKEKYSVLNNAAINELRASNTKMRATNAAFSAEQHFDNEIVIKKMIAALEETVKILEKKICILKKAERGKEI